MENSKIHNLIIRALSGAVYVGLIVGALLLGAEWFSALMVVFIALAVIELQKLLATRSPINAGVRVTDLLWGLFISSTVFCVDINEFNMALVCAALAVAYIPMRLVLATLDKEGAPVASVLYSALTMMYVVLPLSMLSLAGAFSTTTVLITFILIWVNDTGAYLSGITMGRHKMCERLSPKKTWEGFCGGFLLCVIAGCVSAWIIGERSAAQLAMWGLYAAVVSIVGTYGDLFESLIKRTLGVKDSGHLIPGHGGILDRIDSILAVAPFALLMAIL